jgi:hypothetical protein
MKKAVLAAFVLGAAVLAGCGNRQQAEAPATPAEPEVVQIVEDPSPKFIGLPTTTETAGGDAIASGSPLRDVSFQVNSDVRVEVHIRPTTAAHVQLLDGHGTVLAEADAAANQEVSLVGTPSEGEPHNRVRVSRERPYSEHVPFEFRIKTLPLN